MVEVGELSDEGFFVEPFSVIVTTSVVFCALTKDKEIKTVNKKKTFFNLIVVNRGG